MSLDLYRAGSVPTSGRKNTDRTVCIPRREAGRAGVMSLDLYPRRFGSDQREEKHGPNRVHPPEGSRQGRRNVAGLISRRFGSDQRTSR